ncbi:MAG: hypothetical protein WC464_02105, partial [Bdellovibrionales bacterium]
MSKKDFSRFAPSFAFALAGALFWLGSATPALAQATTLGGMMCYAFENAKPFGQVFQWIAYISGVIAALKGIHHLRMHADNPQNNKIVIPMAYFGGAMCMLALPSFVATLTESLGTGGGHGGVFTCGAVGAVAAAEGLDQVVVNFVSNFKEPLTGLASLTAVLAGLLMIVNGLLKASKYGTDPKTYSVHSILTNLGFGTLLMTIGSNLRTVMASLFGVFDPAASSVLTWTKLETIIGAPVSEEFKLAIVSALTFVQIMGAIAFVRGWLVLKKVVEGG